MDRLIPIPEARIVELIDLFESGKVGSDRFKRSLMGLQVVSLSSLVPPAEALLERLTLETKKNAQILTEDLRFEVPYTLRNALSTSLVHFFRNSLDHGIEPPEIRKQKNKPELATLKLSAQIRSGDLYFVFSDDGAGVDFDQVLKKAIALAVIQESRASHLTEAEKFNLLFVSGLSSKEVSNHLSGRGVGLDAVKNEIESVGGKITAQKGKTCGTDFICQIPLETFAAEVRPVKTSNALLYLRPEEILSVDPILTGQIPTKSGSILFQIFGNQSASRYRIRLKGDQILLAEDLLPNEFRLFRRLDPVWSQAGPTWVKDWLNHTRGGALATRLADHKNPIGMLLDSHTLERLN